MKLFAQILLFVTITVGCHKKKEFDIQGHRGCRGLYPENSLSAFEHAVKLGVTTLELDVVISQDFNVVVSHEPFFSHEYCALPSGERIKASDEQTYNLYKMPYQRIKQFECGLLVHPRFPNQQKVPSYKPLLHEVITVGDSTAKQMNRPLPSYNVELKSTIAGTGKYHPEPAVFVDLVIQALSRSNITGRVTLQSFDLAILRELHQRQTPHDLALLLDENGTFEDAISSLGFYPDIYSCNYNMLAEGQVQKLHEQGLRVIPWTVNDTSSMKALISWQVDGIITDYPDRLIELIQEEESK